MIKKITSFIKRRWIVDTAQCKQKKNSSVTRLLSIVFIFHCSLFLVHCNAQDALYAQYYTAPQHLNPAMTGVFQGSARVNANYREQWTGVFSDIPLRTIHAGGEYKLPVFGDDYLSFGISGMLDEIGSSTKLQTTKGQLGISYSKQLDGSRYRSSSQYLVAGLQFGAAQQKLEFGNLWFDRQYDSVNVAVNSQLPTGELAPQSNIYSDMNLGLLWYNVFADNKSFYIGGAIDHISQPKISFFGDAKEVLRRRYTIHAGGEIPFSDELSILPSLMFTTQGSSMTVSGGGNFRYSNHDWNELAVRAGLATRFANSYVVGGGSSVLMDAITVSFILEKDHFLFGASYDIHTSSIATPTNGRGAFEVSIIYVAPEKKSVSTACPKF